MNEPGLVSRTVVAVDDEYAMVREFWDLTVPGCPMVAAFGTPSVVMFARTLIMHPLEAKAIEQIFPPASDRGCEP